MSQTEEKVIEAEVKEAPEVALTFKEDEIRALGAIFDSALKIGGIRHASDVTFFMNKFKMRAS